MSDAQRVPPPRKAPEKQMLTSFLDYHRATLLQKAAGLSEAELRRAFVPSGTSLLGIVKHLGWTEAWWFRICFAGESIKPPWTDEDPDADWRVEPGETSADVFDFYRAQVEHSRKIAEAAASLDETSRRANLDQVTLRWILVHMIEETSRHNGHADILRELTDGATGE
jgi:uncharacterized damage-inducible protein DinB